MLGPPAMGAPARRGDVGLMAFDGWPLGMICTGAMWAFRHGTRGIRMIRCEPEIFWNVGFKPKCHKHSGS